MINCETHQSSKIVYYYDALDRVGFALYLLTVGWKQERSTGVEAKRRGRESVIDLKNHFHIRFCSPFILP
ncbi:hypothetical protein R3W88_016427 [Solanum pinnatisectum]|uniref:Uncharacterized protein n=1 Tax=Solanum pinnatisectum TaxID=50273 RepID=A0AAV9KXJ7_9SOLN|nr:hypothetical protein R3W88_016427 [Solanum pinnatisectum]